jgi:hypothetical protein
MSGLEVRHFDREPTFQCTGSGPLFSPEIEKQIAQIWREAAADTTRRLRDDLILCVTGWDENIEVAPVRYRYILAQMLRPRLFLQPLTALAVSGIATCEGKFVLGRRADWVRQDPGALELAPSGGLNADFVVADGRVNVLAQFDREACEELGVREELLRHHRVLGLVHDEENHVADVVIAASLECEGAELLRAHARLVQPEYSSLCLVSPGELQRMIDDGRERISAVSSAIIGNFGEEAQER